MYGVGSATGLGARFRRPDLTRSRATSLNPLGEVFVLLLIVVVIVGALSREPIISAVGALAFVVAIASRIWAALSLEEITVDRSTSVDHAFIGDEIEITFNDDSIQYITSSTNYLNDDDKQFLNDIGVDLTTIKSLLIYKL